MTAGNNDHRNVCVIWHNRSWWTCCWWETQLLLWICEVKNLHNGGVPWTEKIGFSSVKRLFAAATGSRSWHMIGTGWVWCVFCHLTFSIWTLQYTAEKNNFQIVQKDSWTISITQREPENSQCLCSGFYHSAISFGAVVEIAVVDAKEKVYVTPRWIVGHCW